MKTRWAVILVVNEVACVIEILSEYMCVGAMKYFKIFGYDSDSLSLILKLGLWRLKSCNAIA